MHFDKNAWLLGMALLLAAPAAAALDDYGRWHGSAMISGIDEDRDRGLETEWSGYHLGLARGIDRNWAVEMNLVGTRFKNRDDDVALRQWGFGADVRRRIVDTEHFAPYVLGGIGWMMSDYKLNREDRDGATASVGLGMMVPLFALDMSVRTELRARRDFGGDPMTDYLFSVGIQVPFSFVDLGPAAAPRRSDGTLPPEAEAQPFGFRRDTDADGVADLEDQCPGTAPGTVADNRGCALEDDVDGDGVANPRDMCPDTPSGAPVDAHGCMIAMPADADSDE